MYAFVSDSEPNNARKETRQIVSMNENKSEFDNVHLFVRDTR